MQNYASNNKTRTILTIAAVAIGIILLAYGALSSTTDVAKGPVGQSPPSLNDPCNTLQLTQSQLIKDVTIAGVTRWNDGTLQRTYSGSTVPDDFCPT